ncbi:hypothetical protein [Methylobacter svalbardensis]|uniref:TubC N-terminal docking domain-related protein n=1 Tax=Methylobacter svalbardensis TaxID=3080016 RepID=UPI0030EF2DEF
MSLQQVFASMQEKNIVISELDGELVVRAPQGAMDQALMAGLKAHKQEFLAALRNGLVMEAHAAAPQKITPDMLTAGQPDPGRDRSDRRQRGGGRSRHSGYLSVGAVAGRHFVSSFTGNAGRPVHHPLHHRVRQPHTAECVS